MKSKKATSNFKLLLPVFIKCLVESFSIFRSIFFYSLGPQIAIHLKNALHFGFKEVFEDLRNN